MTATNKNIKQDNVYIEPKVAAAHKRFAAFFIDLVVFILLLTGVTLVVGEVAGYNRNAELLEEKYVEHGIYVMDEKLNEYVFCDTSNEVCQQGWITFNQDEEACAYYDKSVELTTLILTISVFVTYSIVELVVPLIFKNGQTLGMHFFKIGLVSNDGVRINPKQVFIRFLFGKYIVATMIPIYALIFLFFNLYGGLLGLITFASVLGIDLLMTLTSPKKAGIANSIASCFACDLDTSMIYDTIEEVNAIKGAEQERKNQKIRYF